MYMTMKLKTRLYWTIKVWFCRIVGCPFLKDENGPGWYCPRCQESWYDIDKASLASEHILRRILLRPRGK